VAVDGLGHQLHWSDQGRPDATSPSWVRRAFNLSGSSASQWAVTSRPSFSEVRYHAQLLVDWIQGHLA
jgi:hypothetical protein